jgi:ribosomal-protein-alanine N-acetyltransferase
VTAVGVLDGVLLGRMTMRDVPEVERLEREAFSDPWSAASFASALASPATFLLCARSRGDALLGYVVAWFAGGEGEVANLAVAAPSRGQGIGGLLLDAALDEGRAQETESVYLEVRASNTAALKLYSSRGFQQVGRRRSYYAKPVEDAILLRLDLTQST